MEPDMTTQNSPLFRGMPRFTLCFVLFLWASSVFAQVYKCTAADGSVSFTDKPCEGKAELVDDADADTSGVDSGGGPASSITLADGTAPTYVQSGFEHSRGLIPLSYSPKNRG